MTGKKFGLLSVIGFSRSVPTGEHSSTLFWNCICDCGNLHEVRGNSIKNGHTRSCGCMEIANRLRGINRKHGMTETPEYKAFHGMWGRCTNPKNNRYHLYGARGVTVCDRWRSFELFISDVGLRPTSFHSIGRIDNDGNYEPGNVEWSTEVDQANNRRSNRIVEFNGARKTIAQWGSELHIKPHTLWCRIFRYGWDVSRAMTFPVRCWRCRTT